MTHLSPATLRRAGYLTEEHRAVHRAYLTRALTGDAVLALRWYAPILADIVAEAAALGLALDALGAFVPASEVPPAPDIDCDDDGGTPAEDRMRSAAAE